MPSLNNLSMLVDLGIRKQRKTSSAMLFEELLTIIFCYYLHSLRKQLSHAIKDDTLSSSQQDSQSILYGFCKRYFAFLKKGRPIQVIIFNLQKKCCSRPPRCNRPAYSDGPDPLQHRCDTVPPSLHMYSFNQILRHRS